MKEDNLSVKASQILSESPTRVTRRQFLAGASTAALAGISIVPSQVVGADAQPAPSERLNLAGVGIGGQGGGVLNAIINQEVQVAAYYFPHWGPVAQSEWRSIKAAKPRFEGHAQPKIPVWGYENEKDPSVRARRDGSNKRISVVEEGMLVGPGRYRMTWPQNTEIQK